MRRSGLTRLILVGTVCVVLAATTSSSFAKKSKSNSNSKPAQTTPPPPTPTTAPVPDNNNEVAKAEAVLLAAEAKAKRQFESSAQWTTAEDAVSKAQTDAQAANATVGSSMRAQPEYIQASAAVTKAEDKLQQAKDDGGDGSEISTAATELMTARSALGAIQTKAAAADPSVVAASEKLSSAYLAVEQLRKSETVAVQADPDWKAAKQAYNDARSKLASGAN